MSESSIPVPGTGEDLRTFLQDVSGQDVHVEAVAIVDPDDPTEKAGVLGGRLKTVVLNQLVPDTWDYFEAAYDGNDNMTSITFRDGGPGGTITGVTELTYTNDNIVSGYRLV